MLFKHGNKWKKKRFLHFQALKLKPDNAKALFRRGQSYLNMRDFDKAEKDLKAAEKLEPKGLQWKIMSPWFI